MEFRQIEIHGRRRQEIDAAPEVEAAADIGVAAEQDPGPAILELAGQRVEDRQRRHAFARGPRPGHPLAAPLEGLARKVMECVRSVTDKPVSHLVLTHYHAVRVLGASAYGAREVIMSDTARAMVAERGQEDWDSEFGRFPRLFQGHEEIPGLTWPTTTFSDSMTVYLGKRRVDILHLGRAHTAGDAVIWVPDQEVMFTGDIVEYQIPASKCRSSGGRKANWRTGCG